MTIKAGGLATMSPAEAAGTPYGAATALLHAQVTGAGLGREPLALPLDLRPRRPRADSAVFIDNLTLRRRSPSSCPTGVTSLGPAVAITGPTVAATVDTPTPTLTGTAGNAPATRR